MNLPKIKIINVSLTAEIDGLYDFLFEDDWGWKKYILRKHPEIKKVFLLKSKNDRKRFLKKYVVEFRKNNIKTIEHNRTKYQKNWAKIEKDFLILLSKIMGINWPKSKKTIKAMMSINPICPRFLNSWSFFIFCNYKKETHAMEVIMHESCHFLYFEKWKIMHPKMSLKKFESPYIEWHLSEIIAPIILNDKRIQKLLKQKAVFYEEHDKIKIGTKTAPKYFTNLYYKNLKESNDFEQFLNKSYHVIKKNKKLFNI